MSLSNAPDQNTSLPIITFALLVFSILAFLILAFSILAFSILAFALAKHNCLDSMTADTTMQILCSCLEHEGIRGHRCQECKKFEDEVEQNDPKRREEEREMTSANATAVVTRKK
jgi:hypothetical protein